MKNRALFIKIFVFLSVILTLSLYAKVTPPHPKISVIIPTFNREKLLPRAIDSILNQTFQDFEIIVIDDASTDNTKQILKQYQKNSNKIKVITHSTNQGVSAARNTGNAHATGTYITNIDSDDFAQNNFLEEAYTFMETHPDVTIGIPEKNVFFASQNSEQPDKKNTETPTLHYWHYPTFNFVAGNSFGNVGNIFRRDFIIKHNIKYNTEYSCGEDYDFWLQMILKGATAGRIPTKTPLINFKIYGGLSRSGNCFNTVNDIKASLYKTINYKIEAAQFDACTALEHALKALPHALSDMDKKDIEKMCPLETNTAIRVEHPYWDEYLIFSPVSG